VEKTYESLDWLKMLKGKSTESYGFPGGISICFTFFPIQISSLRASPVAKFQEKFYKEHKATCRSFAQWVFGDLW